MSPITRARFQEFRKHRKGYYSLIIFLGMFGISLFAEFIANDKPLFIYYNQGFYFPIFKTYPESTFGSSLEINTNYRDPYIKKLICQKGWMVWPPIPYGYDTVNEDLTTPAPSSPTHENWLGTDDQGRDVLARLIYGFRTAILFGFCLTTLTTLIGTMIGAIQGYMGGMVDLLGQRFIEIWSSMPLLFFLIILSSLVEPSFWWLLFMVTLFRWMRIVPIIRAEFLKARHMDYVRAARIMGGSSFHIMIYHILPNAIVAALGVIPFMMTSAIATLATLDFLGFGLPLGSPSLGEIITQSRNNLFAPWIGISIFFTLSVLLISLVFVGEAIRDTLNPLKRR